MGKKYLCNLDLKLKWIRQSKIYRSLKPISPKDIKPVYQILKGNQKETSHLSQPLFLCLCCVLLSYSCVSSKHRASEWGKKQQIVYTTQCHSAFLLIHTEQIEVTNWKIRIYNTNYSKLKYKGNKEIYLTCTDWLPNY